MKHFLTLSILFSANVAMAEIIRSPIHSVVMGDSTRAHQIRFANGRVAFLPFEEKSLVFDLEQASRNGDLVEAKLSDKFDLVAAQTVEEGVALSFLREERAPAIANYEPTIISMSQANEIFKRFNNNYVRASECSNRAHVWAHEEFTNHGTKSMKAFLLLTASYIDRVRFKWWFHVAPMFAVKNGGKVENMVFDYMFNHGPVTAEQWKNNFVFSQRNCKMDGRFTEYDQAADQTEDCYMFYENMYYWLPGDIGNRELNGRDKTEFNKGELRAAYSEAF